MCDIYATNLPFCIISFELFLWFTLKIPNLCIYTCIRTHTPPPAHAYPLLMWIPDVHHLQVLRVAYTSMRESR